MTKDAKKKIIDKHLVDKLKKISKIEHKSGSHINKKGDLIRDKYVRHRDESERLNDLPNPDLATLPTDVSDPMYIIERKFKVDDGYLYDDDERRDSDGNYTYNYERKKIRSPKPKRKPIIKCRCKK